MNKKLIIQLLVVAALASLIIDGAQAVDPIDQVALLKLTGVKDVIKKVLALKVGKEVVTKTSDSQNRPVEVEVQRPSSRPVAYYVDRAPISPCQPQQQLHQVVATRRPDSVDSVATKAGLKAAIGAKLAKKVLKMKLKKKGLFKLLKKGFLLSQVG